MLKNIFSGVKTSIKKLRRHITKLNIPVVLVERQRQVVHAQLRPWLCSVECHGQHHFYQTYRSFSSFKIFVSRKDLFIDQISIVQIYHLGTVAFGSLILAIIRTIKTILEYIEKKCKKFNNDLTK